jgi:hypothetical protein
MMTMMMVVVGEEEEAEEEEEEGDGSLVPKLATTIRSTKACNSWPS